MEMNQVLCLAIDVMAQFSFQIMLEIARHLHNIA